MHSPAYDVFRKEGTALVWVEAIHDVGEAKPRIEELARRSRSEYVVFDQRTRRMVANVDGRVLKPLEHEKQHSGRTAR